LIPLSLLRTKRICQSHHTLLRKENEKRKRERKIKKKARPIWFSLSITKKKYPLQHLHQFNLIFFFFFFQSFSECLGKLHPLFIMVGPPNSSGNLAQRGGERERERGKHQDKNKPYTFPLFSPFKTQIELCCFLCFCCIRDSLLLFQVKEERKKKKKIKKEKKKS